MASGRVLLRRKLRQGNFGIMRNITQALRSMNTIREFDKELFGMLVEQIKVINLA